MSMVFSVGPKKGTPREHYYTNKIGIDTMKQSVVAWPGKCVVTAEADEFWCSHDGGSKSYKSKVFDNPTWGQLFACAKAAQKRTGDYHHAFFEGIYTTKDGVKSILDGVEVTVLKLVLGS